jgi:hypothetical protein
MELEQEPDVIPAGPKPIQRLDADVVNQIAAAEVSSVPFPLSEVLNPPPKRIRKLML